MQSMELHNIHTLQEYFLLEEAGEVRHEFINGNLIEMSGASREHYKICKNILRILENLLTDKGYEVFIENMKVKICPSLLSNHFKSKLRKFFNA